jgi:hypothetical protein
MAKLAKVSSQTEFSFQASASADDLAGQIRLALARAIRRCRRSAQQIADEMSLRLATRVTPTILYNCTAESHPHRFPAEWVPAFCAATGDYGVLRVQIEALGLPMPERNHGDLVAFARAQIQAELAGHEAAGHRARLMKGAL